MPFYVTLKQNRPTLTNKYFPMYTTYHLSSAQELTADIVDAIKTAFKSKPISITIQEEMDTTAYLMSSPANKAMLDKSLEQARNGEFIELQPEQL